MTDATTDVSNEAERRATRTAPADAGTVLIVDDEIPFLRMLQANLRRRGYSVRAATTGAQALSHVARRRPDAIILDMGLPDTDGLEVIAQQRFLSEIWSLKDGSNSNNYLRVFMVTIRRKLEPDPSQPRYFITEPGRGVRLRIKSAHVT
jgi:DNA-binding response OmpR family regulator